jgi:hypothetical protein
MNTLKDVKQQARAINGDPDGEWMTDTYLLPIINHLYTLQVNYLSNFCSPFIESVATILNLQPGQTDLSLYQANGKPLSGLVEPYREGIHWKIAGDQPSSYVPAKKTDTLPYVTPATPGPRFQLWWEWRSFKLFITPMTQAIDLEVRGDFRPPVLVQDDDIIVIHPTMDAVLAEETAAAAWRERQNAGALQTYQLVFTSALDDIANQLVRGEQGTPLRLARANGRRCGWR